MFFIIYLHVFIYLASTFVATSLSQVTVLFLAEFSGKYDLTGLIDVSGTLAVRRVGRYEVVTYPNTTVPDVIVHAAAETKPTSSGHRLAGSSGDHVTSADVTPLVQSPDSVDRRPPAAAGVWTTQADDGRKLSTCGGGSSSSLPQLSLVSGRQQPALDKTGSNNLSLSALHAAAHVDAASQRQVLIRSRACRPCHDLSKVTVDRPRFGSHFRLSAVVADLAQSGERAVVSENIDRSTVLQSVIVCDAVHHSEKDTGSAVEVPRQPDPAPHTSRVAAVDGHAITGRTLLGRGGLAVLSGVRAWWSKSDETSQSCAESWRDSLACRRRSAEEKISFALTRVSLVRC